MATDWIKTHDDLKCELQALYNGSADQYDPTNKANSVPDNGRLVWPPPGMVFSEMYMQLIDQHSAQVRMHKSQIATLEFELGRHPLVIHSPHPMLRLPNAVSTRSPEKRGQLIREIALAEANLRMAQETLDYWTNKVQAASPLFLKNIFDAFQQKQALREILLTKYQTLVPAW